MTEKQQFEIEYPINASPKVLFTRLSTAGGLAEWFADDVNLEGGCFTFIWEGHEQKAELVVSRENRLVRFKWVDEDSDKSYFEFRISQHEITGDVSLLITDFAEPDDVEDAINLWDKQINQLKSLLGSGG